MDKRIPGLPSAQPTRDATESAIVYVRPVAVADLPDALQEQVIGLTTIYSVNRPNGERLALVADRQLAFALARQNDMAPVSVH